MTREDIEKCWNDPANWKWGVYYCKADPRAIVPKHIKWMGWTINFARPSAFPILLFMFAILIIPVLIAKNMGAGTVQLYCILGIAVISICALSAYLSSRTN